MTIRPWHYLLSVCLPLLASAADSGTASPQQYLAFIQQAAGADIAEVKFGSLALRKSASGEVKRYAQKMIDDHSKHFEDLKVLATKEGLSVPGDMDAGHNQLFGQLEQMTPQEFDRAYLDAMRGDHADMARKYSDTLNNTQDEDVRRFAQATLPIIEQHQKMTEDLAAK